MDGGVSNGIYEKCMSIAWNRVQRKHAAVVIPAGADLLIVPKRPECLFCILNMSKAL